MPALRNNSWRRGDAEASTSIGDIVRGFVGRLAVNE